MTYKIYHLILVDRVKTSLSDSAQELLAMQVGDELKIGLYRLFNGPKVQQRILQKAIDFFLEEFGRLSKLEGMDYIMAVPRLTKNAAGDLTFLCFKMAVRY